MKLFVVFMYIFFLLVFFPIRNSVAQTNSRNTGNKKDVVFLHPDDVYWNNKFAHPGLFNRAQAVTQLNSTTMVFAGIFKLPNENGQFETYLLAYWDGSG